MSQSNDLVRIGSVIKPHGVKGEVKVYPTTDDVRRFETVGTVLLNGPSISFDERTVESVKYFKDLVIVKLSGVPSMEEAEKLRGHDLLIPIEKSSPLKPGQYFLFDLIGLTVFTENGRELGKVEEILTTAANDVFVVRDASKKEILLPNIPDCILEVSPEKGVMKVALLPGLES